MDKGDITVDVVARLVANQFPEWAGMPIRAVDHDGWDNCTFRLGEELSVRLPSHERYVAQVEKEHRWLPVLAPQLPQPIPTPIAKGEPDEVFPRPWSVYGWIVGDLAMPDGVADPTRFAHEVAAFLAALYAIDVTDGPVAGEHSHHRGCGVEVWDEQTRRAIAALGDEIDHDGALATWEAAIHAEPNHRPRWVHGDVIGSNLLVRDGHLHGVLDFGCSAVGDPACDLVIAWMTFVGDSRRAFCDDLALDDATWARARGWALWKATITLGMALAGGRGEGNSVARRGGWRIGPRAVIEEVIADHRALVDA